MALKIYKSGARVESTVARLKKLAARLGPDECFKVADVAREIGATHDACIASCRRHGFLEKRYGLDGNPRATAVFVNPAHKKKGT